MNYYGYNRSTGDIDLLIEDSLENRKKLRKMLAAADIGDFETIETIVFLPGWTDFTLNTGLRLDIMTNIKGNILSASQSYYYDINERENLRYHYQHQV